MSLKQSSKESSNPRPSTEDLDRACWHRDRNCTCLKIDVAPGESFLFPYQQFLHAQYTITTEDETLRISFGAHEIVVSGKRLAEIAAAFQELAVERISPVPPRFRQLPQDQGAWVTQIEVRPSS